MKRQSLLLLLNCVLIWGCSPRSNGPPPPPPKPNQSQPSSTIQNQSQPQEDFYLENDSEAETAVAKPIPADPKEPTEFSERRLALDQSIRYMDQAMQQTEAQMGSRCMVSDFSSVKFRYSMILEDISDLEVLAQIEYDRSVGQNGGGDRNSNVSVEEALKELATIKSTVSKGFQGFVSRYSNSSSECAEVVRSVNSGADGAQSVQQ